MVRKIVVSWKFLIVCLIIVYAVAFVGSLFTSNKVNSEWFNSIKPSITPPNYIFPIVWNILYFLIALSLYFSFMNGNKKERVKVSWVFGVNLVLNLLWSLFYFGIQNVFLAFVDIILIWLTIIWMMFVTWRIDKKASYLLIPYFIWVSFASVLNWLSL